MPTPTSTSVGASTPSAIRARATRVISPAATHLPVLRQRPSGTSVYSTAIRPAVRKATCTDGIAQPPQLVRSSTPNGRGRRPIMARPKVSKLSELHDDPPDDQVPPAPQDQQHQQQAVGQRVQHPPRGDAGQAPQGRHQPRPDQAGQPTHHRVVHHGDRHRRAPQPPGEDRQGQPDQHHRRHQPADPAGLQPIRQGRGRPGGPPPPRRPDRLPPGWGPRAGRWSASSGLRARPWAPPYRRYLAPGRTTLFAGFWVVKAVSSAMEVRTDTGPLPAAFPCVLGWRPIGSLHCAIPMPVTSSAASPRSSTASCTCRGRRLPFGWPMARRGNRPGRVLPLPRSHRGCGRGRRLRPPSGWAWCSWSR